VSQAKDRFGKDRYVRHGHQADPQVGVRMHRDPEPEGLAQPREVLRLAQATPVVVVGQDDLHAVQGHAAPELAEVGDHHVGGQGQTRSALPPNRPVRMACRRAART
jgi:hypothetical protein